jgi:hypothetical protein
VRGKCDNFDVIFTQKAQYLRSELGTAVIHEQHSFRLRITWISPQRSDVRDRLMANEVFKKLAIDIWLSMRSVRNPCLDDAHCDKCRWEPCAM